MGPLSENGLCEIYLHVKNFSRLSRYDGIKWQMLSFEKTEYSNKNISDYKKNRLRWTDGYAGRLSNT